MNVEAGSVGLSSPLDEPGVHGVQVTGAITTHNQTHSDAARVFFTAAYRGPSPHIKPRTMLPMAVNAPRGKWDKTVEGNPVSCAKIYEQGTFFFPSATTNAGHSARVARVWVLRHSYAILTLLALTDRPHLFLYCRTLADHCPSAIFISKR